MFIDPKLIKISNCKKYVYPVDSITGATTFAPIEYFTNKVKEKYGGNVEKFVKEYVTRETKKYLKEGWEPEQLRELVKQHGKLPKLDKKPKKDPNAPKKERKKRATKNIQSVQIIVDESGKEQKIVTYPWSGDPTNYFRSKPVPINIAEETRSSCMRPNIYLDDQCHGCPYYTECQCSLKVIPKTKKL